MYKIRWHKEAVKELQKIPSKMAKQILDHRGNLMLDAYQGKALKGSKLPFRSLRVGDYRVIYLIKNGVINIYRIGSRGSIYKEV